MPSRVAVSGQLAGHAVGVERGIAVAGRPADPPRSRAPTSTYSPLEPLHHGLVLVAGEQPLVELGVHGRLEVGAVVLDVETGVGVGRDDDVRGVALVDAVDGIGHGIPLLIL
jgi:hypothetical protein